MKEHFLVGKKFIDLQLIKICAFNNNDNNNDHNDHNNDEKS